MIYLATALYCEAKPLIETYQLKKDVTQKMFQIFRNESISLIITKSGKVNAAIAINELFHHIPPTRNDVFVNVGIAGCANKDYAIGFGGLCLKIKDADTNRDFYTDVLMKHPFSELFVTTVSSPVTNEIEANQTMDDAKLQEASFLQPPVVFDMEASGIYTAATMYLQQHQIFFYKVISDHLLKETVTPDQITKLLTAHVEPLMNFLVQVHSITTKHTSTLFTIEEEEWLQNIGEQLYFSVTMIHQFRQLFAYYKLSGNSVVDYLSSLHNKLTQNPCKSKKEGKEQFEQIRNQLL